MRRTVVDGIADTQCGFCRVLVEWLTIRANLSRGVYGELPSGA